MGDDVYKLLMRPRKIRAKIKHAQAEIEGLELSMLPSGIRYDKDNVVQSSGMGDPMAEYAVRLEELEKKLGDLRMEYLDAQDDIVRITAGLDDLEQTIILQRYISDTPFSQIAEDIPMSERNMFRHYRQAVAKLSQVVSECQ